jgi:ubiquinol-cytochrome c reductase iron-sulfur subunit
MDRRGFLGFSLTAITGLAGFFASIPFVKSFLPSARARSRAGPIEVDLGRVGPGQVAAYSYRGETMLVLRRTAAMLAELTASAQPALDTSPLPDPSYVSPEHRAINPEYLVVRGVCTHLGCVPQKKGPEGKQIVGDWWTGGFICPCHQSGFDYAGRVIRGPAGRNLPIPPHRYLGPTRLVIGEEPEAT